MQFNFKSPIHNCIWLEFNSKIISISLVGKKFPNQNVDAMNEMGDTFKINVLEEALKGDLVLVPQRLYLRLSY